MVAAADGVLPGEKPAPSTTNPKKVPRPHDMREGQGVRRPSLFSTVLAGTTNEGR